MMILQACLSYQIGQVVVVQELDSIGTVVSIHGDTIVVNVNGLHIDINRYNLLPLTAKGGVD